MLYKAMILAGTLLSAVHAADWARHLWQKEEKRPQATVIAILCVLVLALAVKAVTVV